MSAHELPSSASAGAYERAVERAPALLAGVCRRCGIRGAVLGIADRSGQTRMLSLGSLRTVAGDERAASDHRFLLTSVSKVIAAAQVLSFVATGDVDLNDPIGRVLPEFACRGKERVTIAHVLSHTSGVRRRTANTAEQLTPELDAAAHIARALHAKATWSPGTRVEYSSSPFWALAELCTRAGGRSYVDHLQDWARDRLGVSISYAPGPALPPRYVQPDEPLASAFAEQTRRLAYPAGGVIAAVADVLAFARAFLDDESGRKLLPQDLRALMARPVTQGLPGRREPGHSGNATERALGWAVGGPGRRRPGGLLWHSGVSGTSVWVDRPRGLVAVFLSARWFLPRSFFGELADGLFAAR
jgi:CubicO group peptidase (beta-lactamase class C family)